MAVVMVQVQQGGRRYGNLFAVGRFVAMHHSINLKARLAEWSDCGKV